MQVVRAIYDEHGIRAIDPIQFKRQTEVLVIFPNEEQKPGTAEARKMLRGCGKGEKLTEKLLKYRAEDFANESR
ncbi:MAG: hypothetical protein L0Y76_13490 [Ignavibacteria bacterium]|nr:hypothetical protein [Ignavibacteria bacterium]